MLDNKKIAAFISEKRKRLGMTQAEVAARLNVSFQAVSKWENGTLPNVEILVGLAGLLHTSVDEILQGREKNSESFSYSKAGVDISYTDALKREMAVYLNTNNPRVLNGLGPLAVLDTIVCGKAEKETMKAFIKGISEACRENECDLVGGETSIQPEVVNPGLYILTSSIAGIVPRGKIIDGSDISEGDKVLAAASNGLHTNGYTLVRLLMEKMPQIKLDRIQGETFIEQIMKPHTPYYPAIKALLRGNSVRGLAHITGGGIKGNLCRIIPEGLSAEINLNKLKTLPIFAYIQKAGNIEEQEMLSTFNCGAGLLIVVKKEHAKEAAECMKRYHDCYEIGEIRKGKDKVIFQNHILFDIHHNI